MATRAASPSFLALVCLGGLQLALSAVFIVVFAGAPGDGPRLVWLHLSTLGAVGALAASALYAVLRLFPSGTARRLVAAAAAGLTVGLWLLYAADGVSNWFWRHNVTWELAARYLARPRVLAGYVLLVIDWPVLVAGGVLLLAAALYLVFSRRVDEGLRFVQALPAARGRAAGAALGLAALLLGMSALLAVMTVPAGARRLVLQRDPLIGLFVHPERPDRLGLAALAAQYRAEGPAVRARYPRQPAFERRNVVVIVADSLRADHLSLYGYTRATTPFLQGLHERGHLRVVRQALATCPDSACGISSLMTSKTFGSLVRENFKLHELLRDRGYAVHFVLSGDHDWMGLRTFYGDEVTTYFDGTASRAHDVTDDRVLFEGLERIAPFDGQPAFFYVHLMSTHVLGVRQEEHLVYRPSRARTTWALYERDDHEMRVNNYDNGVRQADAVIGQLFAALDQKGYLRDALVVITSDHGEGLGERGPDGFGHAGWLYQEFIRIPLLIHDPGDTAYASLDFATHVDVAPTIVDRLGLPVPGSWEGHSLLRPAARRFSHHLMPDPPHRAVVHPAGDRIYKLLRQDGREELFELTTDPGERRNLISSAEQALVGELRRRLEEALAERVSRARAGTSRD